MSLEFHFHIISYKLFKSFAKTIYIFVLKKTQFCIIFYSQECLETGRKYKYHEVFSKSFTLAKFLRNNLKLTPGNTIAIVLPNVPEYAIIIFGSAQAGLKITTVNPIYTSGEYTTFTCIS